MTWKTETEDECHFNIRYKKHDNLATIDLFNHNNILYLNGKVSIWVCVCFYLFTLKWLDQCYKNPGALNPSNSYHNILFNTNPLNTLDIAYYTPIDTITFLIGTADINLFSQYLRIHTKTFLIVFPKRSDSATNPIVPHT